MKRNSQTGGSNDSNNNANDSPSPIPPEGGGGGGGTIMDQLQRQKSEMSATSDENTANNSKEDDELNRAADFTVHRVQTDFLDHESMEVMTVDENERFDPRMNSWSGAHLLPSDPSK